MTIPQPEPAPKPEPPDPEAEAPSAPTRPEATNTRRQDESR
jgi:hypothetical protein